MTSFSHLLGSSTKILMLIPEYYDQWADRMQDYLNGLDEDLWNCISGEINPPATVQSIGASSSSSEVENQSNRLKQLEKKYMRELRVELKDFKQKESESIEVYYDRFNELIYRCNRYGIIRSSMEFNLIFNKSSDSKGNFENKNRVDEKLKEVKKDSKSEMEKMEKMLKEKLEEVKLKAKNLSLVAHGETESDGTYQIWSSGSDDEEMKNPSHGVMFAKMEEDSDEEQTYEVRGQCFVSKSTDKSPMTTKVRKEKCEDLLVKIDTDQPSTSKVCDMEFVEIHDSQIDYSDNEEESTNSKTNKSSKEVEIPRVVVDQVYMDSQEFEQILSEEGAHYLETNIVVYPIFKCTDDIVFPNQIFVTTGNVENIKPEFKILVEEDNKKTSDEGFFSNQSTIENNLTKNSYIFQRQKPKRIWVEKSKLEKKIVNTTENVFTKHDNVKPEIKEVNKAIKLNSKEFKAQVEKFSKENNISKHQAIDVERNVKDNQQSENSKLDNDSISCSNQNTNAIYGGPMEGEHLDSNSFVEGEHSYEADVMSTNVNVEGEPIIEAEPIIEGESIIEGEPILEKDPILEEEHFDDAEDACSINGSENDAMFEDAPLDF
ncbi:uncharacterized protein LOC128127833 [Lactuca sativa]|uniref:uncharacterized protein LOC128127833 n=1 Tax=Lactuca sativa TaxID=4236 RepID=UPI0022AEF8C4|nr:uncharacterized protein LOC128127833 [Lactuca sativa]